MSVNQISVARVDRLHVYTSKTVLLNHCDPTRLSLCCGSKRTHSNPWVHIVFVLLNVYYRPYSIMFR